MSRAVIDLANGQPADSVLADAHAAIAEACQHALRPAVASPLQYGDVSDTPNDPVDVTWPYRSGLSVCSRATTATASGRRRSSRRPASRRRSTCCARSSPRAATWCCARTRPTFAPCRFLPPRAGRLAGVASDALGCLAPDDLERQLDLGVPRWRWGRFSVGGIARCAICTYQPCVGWRRAVPPLLSVFFLSFPIHPLYVISSFLHPSPVYKASLHLNCGKEERSPPQGARHLTQLTHHDA